MIYKFHFEMCDDNNKLRFAMSEESGNFWKAYTAYMAFLVNFIKAKKLHE